MTNALHPNDYQTLARHHDSMMTTLAHRLAVARASQNDHLVALLERERQQIAAHTALNEAMPSPTRWLRLVAQRLTKAIFGGAELQVSEIVDGSDRWWVASNPQTGQLVYADSEAELRLWIKENYQGK